MERILDKRFWGVMRVAPWVVATGLLAAPAVAMRFTSRVDWTPSDFLVAGFMLYGACGLWEVAFRLSGSAAYRMGAGIAVGTGLLLTWANLAVGVIGDEGEPINLIFFGVLAIGLIGAFLGNFRALGMARTTLAMAIAQFGCSALILITGWDTTWALAAFFGFAWLLSAWLFREAARQEAAPAG